MRTRRVQRAQTMGSLLKSIVTGVVVVVIVTIMLSELGYDIAPLIASAGIIGVALGFGSQTLVKDFLSGIFMIFEDQYGVGDVVDLGEATGTVEAVSLRVTRLRDVNGTVWYVRNGEILRVGNMSQNWARTVLDVGVTYAEDLAHVQRVLARRRARPVGRRGLQGTVSSRSPRCGACRSSAPTACSCASPSRPLRSSSGRSPARCGSGSRRASTYEGIEVPFAQRVLWIRSGDRPTRAPPGPTEAGATGPASRAARGWRRDDHVLRRDRRRARRSARSSHASTRASPTDEVLRPLYPEEDLGPAEERFRLFLDAVLGRPDDVLRAARAPAAADAARAVRGDARRRASTGCVHFRAGLDAAELTAGAGRAVLGLRHPRGAVHGQLAGVTSAPSASSARGTPPGDRRRPSGSRCRRTPPTTRAAGQHVVAVADLGLEDDRRVADARDPRSQQSYGSGRNRIGRR